MSAGFLFLSRLLLSVKGSSKWKKDIPTVFTPVPPQIKFVRGEGVRLFDEAGDDYLDCSTGIAVNCLGHSHPHMVEKLKSALDGVWHLSNLFEIPGQKELAERLCANTFADKVFFTNSGTEAMECAIKTARRYHYDNGQPDRYNIITFEGAFHGRTLAAVNAGGQEKYLEGFGPKLPGFVHVAIRRSRCFEKRGRRKHCWYSS